MDTEGPAPARAASHSAVASLDLLHLMLSCGCAIPAPAERSAIDYIAAYLGDGGCADLVRACLRDVTGSSGLLRERLAPAIGPSPAPDPIAFPGPMPAEAVGLAALLSARATSIRGAGR